MFAKNTKQTKTVFSTNTNMMVSAFNQVNTALANELNLYTLLANALTSINQLFLDFSLGNFSSVSEVLTLDKFSQLSLLFGGLQQNSYKYPNYEEIRTTIVKTLQGLMNTAHLYADLMNVKIQLANCEERDKILTDMKLLEEYIKTLRGITVLFNPEPVTVIAAEIKPQYAMYIKLYGYPANGLFEPDKLAECITLVNAATAAK